MKGIRSSMGLALALALLLPAGAGAAGRTAQAGRDTAMALIPAGEFVMGREGTGDNSPPHTVRLGAFYLDCCEVTNAEYAEFCRATGRDLPKFWGMNAFRSGDRYPDHPVVFVSNGDAREYATWRGKRLPTEAEWEYAARGGLTGKAYVNGDVLDSTKVNYTLSALKGPVAVGSFEPNGYGLYDMAGNVQEWVSDRYDAEYYKTSPAENPPGPAKGRFRVIRGGGWDTGPGCMGVGYRNALPANWIDFNVGFRCARDAAPHAAQESKP
jgi:formylglycine-generating enzyme required for sulfatase activity